MTKEEGLRAQENTLIAVGVIIVAFRCTGSHGGCNGVTYDRLSLSKIAAASLNVLMQEIPVVLLKNLFRTTASYGGLIHPSTTLFLRNHFGCAFSASVADPWPLDGGSTLGCSSVGASSALERNNGFGSASVGVLGRLTKSAPEVGTGSGWGV